MDFKRTGNMIEIGGTVRIEPGPRLVRAEATEELLANDATADHYFAGERDTGMTDNDDNPVMHTGIDAEANPIEVGKEMAYLDWLAFQKDGDGRDQVYYVYQLSKPTAAEKKARETDAPFFREMGIYDTEEEAISAGLSLKPDVEVGMAYLNDNTLDNGLAALKAAATGISICSAEPATYTAATSGGTYLGIKVFGAGAVYPGAIAAGSPSGRKLTTAPVTDGTVSATGTASHYAVVSSGSSRLEVAQSLSATQGVTSGNTFTLTAADVRLPNVGG
jgi:hypothetical protein